MGEENTEVVAEEKETVFNKISEFFGNVVDNFKEMFDFVEDAAEAAFKAVMALFKDEITDALANAAKVAVEAVEATKTLDNNADWSDYLKAAYDAAKDELGDEFKEFSTTAVLTALQAAYAALKAEKEAVETAEVVSE